MLPRWIALARPSGVSAGSFTPCFCASSRMVVSRRRAVEVAVQIRLGQRAEQLFGDGDVRSHSGDLSDPGARITFPRYLSSMTWLVIKIASWLVHALVVMASVGVVSKGNPSNTLPRALLVTFLVALLVTPFAYFWFLLIPGIIAMIAWFLVYTLAYDIGMGQAFAAGLLQVVLGLCVDYFLPPHLHY